ncbi:DUF4255 domain-containing protein [Trinickia caryophylli]|uniref:Pvc16 N-terminal domain-containing protein n=1 Tax=Trinickia caryophylli TaxID=28094 RepID=A0A1X7GA07_TRICW|nr:DUF4255 domain-containing protein [Trinickia caryophylli]WQE11695.1 DUF4255 domain-containing protein [Trinickia caryophylli]GLU34880.1 hypothetical protein Busp01_47220 [Trinickia caryophylli]SMF66546.1 Protein of unknown function [Trinickia caryophylli]
MAVSTIDAEQVIAGVSNALRSFICASVPRIASEAAVTFDSPAKLDSENENKLALYLYQMELNPELRNTSPALSAVQSNPSSLASLTLTPAPLAVDLLYMLVVYGQSAEYEQMIAGSIVNLLDRSGRIPSDFIGPALRASGNSGLAIVPQPASIHVLRDLWAAFPNKAYHLTKLYSISPVRLPAPTSVSADMTVNVNPVGATVTDPPPKAVG